MTTQPITILCVSRFFKGGDFIRSAKSQGNNVYLLTSTKLKEEAWPFESLDDTFYMDEDDKGEWNMQHVIQGLAHKMQGIKFDSCISLDDYDVENTAHIREHFRIPGMGETTARYFRDKLAMRMKAQSSGIPVPAFTALFNDAEIHAYTKRVSPPWLIKPRSAASAKGIKKIHDVETLWRELENLGDKRHRHLLEKFAPGDVFHVDSLSHNGKVLFTRVSQYLDTPFEVAHGGGIFRSHVAAFGSKDDKALQKLNKKVLESFGMRSSASHTEFIKGHADGEYYFLETSSRVGGANLAEMVEFSSGVNLWGEWAKIENAVIHDIDYSLPKVQNHYTGIVVSLSRFQNPDTSSFNDPEICWRMNKDWHIGMIVKSDSRERVLELLDGYTKRIAEEFHASASAEGLV